VTPLFRMILKIKSRELVFVNLKVEKIKE